MPRTSDVVWSIIYVYAILTILCYAAYDILGMTRFDAIIHALTTIPTGGYSTHDASFGYFDSYALHIVATIFMFLGSVPFILYVKFAYKGNFDFFKDQQVQTLMAMLAILIVSLTGYLWWEGYYTLSESFKYAAFNIMSVISTTGYATTDYSLWGPFGVAMFFFIMYLGGCAGSTAGGVKMLRINIAFQTLGQYFKQLVYPDGVFTSRYQNRRLTLDVMHAVMGFLFLFVVCNVVLTIALALTGLDFITAVTATSTALANVGPGLGEIIGPAGNFSTLSDIAKWLLCIGMLLGRLEVMTMLVLIAPSFWRD
jgi:trk system potassium uptake protein TrkH